MDWLFVVLLIITWAAPIVVLGESMKWFIKRAKKVHHGTPPYRANQWDNFKAYIQ